MKSGRKPLPESVRTQRIAERSRRAYDKQKAEHERLRRVEQCLAWFIELAKLPEDMVNEIKEIWKI